MIFILLCVFCCVVERTSAEKHTLQYLYTLRSAPEDDPEFEITTVFDGLIISHCKSPRLVDESRQDWIQQAFTTEEWKSRDLFCESEYYSHRTLKKKIEDVINTTKGIIQRERSCTADDSVVHMSDRWGVNGEDFFTLDPNTLKWSSDSALARSIQSDWNQIKFMTPSLKDFELYQCEPSLIKLKKKKEKYLNSNSRPEVYIFGKPFHDRDTVSLRCYISHKYFPAVRVRLTLDGVVLKNNVKISSPAPNMDGSVQIRLETETSIKEPDRYHCVVDTDNLHITTGWDGQTLDKTTQSGVPDEFGKHEFSNIWIFLILVLAAVGITCFVVVAVKCKKDYNPRTINIAVTFFLRYVLSDEEWERSVEVDDEFFPRWPIGVFSTLLKNSDPSPT
ncbi:uncharacterized protein [Salminus brasiliensis]|uniref:uncharacterized protein n=1 Tax=Salminus brasiliensis TaxID=930266 RepID=UPI003B82ECB0